MNVTEIRPTIARPECRMSTPTVEPEADLDRLVARGRRLQAQAVSGAIMRAARALRGWFV